MKHTLAILSGILLLGHAALAATPEQEKAFVESYKKAFEAGDDKALNSFLHTKGAAQDTIEFFTMMQTAEAGHKVTSIELVTPTKEQMDRYNTPMEMPDGKKYKMPVTPSKMLVIVVEIKDASGSGKSTAKSPVAEIDGKLVIPVPVPAE